MKRIILIVIGFFLFIITVSASKIPVYNVGDEKQQLNNFSVGLIIDPGRKLDIDKIAEMQESSTLVNSRFTISSIFENYWFIIKIKNVSSETIEQIVGFDEVYMETADIYYQTDTGWHHEQNGLSQPMNLRQIENRCPVFYVSLQPGETKTIYLKLHSKFALVVGVFVEDIPVFAKSEQTKIIGYWSYFGAALAILLYNLFLLFHVRERVYLYYVIYAFCLIIFTFLYSGYSLYVNPNPSLHYILHASIALVGAFISLFTRELLKPKNVFKWIDKVLIGISTIYFMLAILIVIDIYFYQWLVLFGMPSMLFLLFTGIISLIKKVPLARYYVIAMSGYLIGLFMIAAVNLALIPFNAVTRYGFLIGSFIELSVFSLALGYRIKLLQEEKIIYQNKLLVSEKSMKSRLEVQVMERTEELTAITEELESTNNELSLQIQENEKAYDALKKSEMDLGKSNSAKDKFFSIIAHDLKGPFNSLIGFSELLIEEVQNGHIDKVEEYCNYIHQQSNLTFKLLLNLLEWSRSQTGSIEYKPEPILLSTFINEVIGLFINETKKKNISLSNNISSDLEVFGDKNMLETVIRNLVSNAIKYTRKNGMITITAVAHEDMIQISVLDTGIGISPENIEKLFIIEHTISTLGTDNEQGTGLGLILCKEFIEKHHGQIWVESDPDGYREGKGSVFHFTLPVTKLEV
nr:sensor histidine kinase [Bacteroidota bacterium]